MTLPKATIQAALSKVREGQRLFLLNLVYADSLEDMHKATAERVALHVACKTLAEGNKIAVVWSGRDCDGMCYRNEVRIVEAHWKTLLDHIEHTYRWADGPCYYTLTKPSIAKDLQYGSRDAILEAFEDGHAWSIHV